MPRMRTSPTSVRLANRAYRRIKRLGAREQGKELATLDPAALEVALAQVDATLAVSAAVQEVVKELAMTRERADERELAQTLPFGDKRNMEIAIGTLQATDRGFQQQLDALSDDVSSLRTSINVLRESVKASTGHSVESVLEERTPWWAFWRWL